MKSCQIYFLNFALGNKFVCHCYAFLCIILVITWFCNTFKLLFFYTYLSFFAISWYKKWYKLCICTKKGVTYYSNDKYIAIIIKYLHQKNSIKICTKKLFLPLLCPIELTYHKTTPIPQRRYSPSDRYLSLKAL